MCFTVYVVCSLRILQLETKGQEIETATPTVKLQNSSQNSLQPWVSSIGLGRTCRFTRNFECGLVQIGALNAADSIRMSVSLGRHTLHLKAFI